MASRRNVVTFLTAPARSGKSFNEVRRICDELLPRESGHIYTNLPLYPEKIADYCERRFGKNRDEVLSRIHIIPEKVEASWRDSGKQEIDEFGNVIGMQPITGPWAYFADKPLSGSTIIIDEIHNFCGQWTSAKIAGEWGKWLGELGHNQAVFRCISQAPEKVHRCIKNEAQAEYSIRNTGLDKDPYFKIEVYDWMELWAGIFGGDPSVYVFEQEKVKVEGKKVEGQRTLYRMGEPYFSMYNSFNSPIAHKQTEGVKKFEHEYEKHIPKGPIRGRLSLLGWFFRKHFMKLVGRISFALLIVAVLVGMQTGHLMKVMQFVMGKVTTTMIVDPQKKRDGKGQGENPAESPIAKPPPRIPTEEEKKLFDEAQKLRQEKGRAEALAREQEKAAQSAGAEAERLRKVIEANAALLLITKDSITLKGGYSYDVGETLDIEPYKGKKLESVFWPRRQAILSDGTILRLSERGVVAHADGVPKPGGGEEEGRTAQSGIPRPVRPAGGGEGGGS